MTFYLPVAGTWSRHRESVQAKLGLEGVVPWYRAGSTFDATLHDAFGCDRFDQDGDPNRPDEGYWSGDLEGCLFSGTWWNPTDRKYVKWIEGGQDLAKVLTGWRPGKNRVVVIAHSHGGQVACYGIRMLAPVFARRVSLITVDMPNRSGWATGRHMAGVYERVGEVLDGRWVHFHSGGGWEDRMRWMGARVFPWQHAQIEHAGCNIEVPDHSSVLQVSEHLAVWEEAFHFLLPEKP